MGNEHCREREAGGGRLQATAPGREDGWDSLGCRAFSDGVSSISVQVFKRCLLRFIYLLDLWYMPTLISLCTDMKFFNIHTPLLGSIACSGKKRATYILQ